MLVYRSGFFSAESVKICTSHVQPNPLQLLKERLQQYVAAITVKMLIPERFLGGKFGKIKNPAQKSRIS